ncbi:ABC transporter ATP-binding protein [Spiribacter halobius]|uniref:ABC transporter ATP-binding protein n=1 Tax=Sediminicurvatus halobius TaxID=2182432 RepID=A0A2U2N5R8_9GAMM|nr:ABC transporter ATP-binding protein [Spiribacter halobius]PWG64319.1 ABC transporter ATP-binding protein [Spiribacter halobius]UEX79337.1 ABC transporter ATP-binding protein [Spiribacter halobius]
MLRIRDLEMSYGAEPVLQNVDLDVAAGEFVSLIGPSGCGKSTLLRAVMGLQAPSHGSVDLAVDRNHVGFLFQDDALLPWRSARDNVALGLRIRGRRKAEARDEAMRWLESVGLGSFGDRYPRELSGGQRKRVAIAQVLALRPKLLLMDEPFASLDAIVRHYLTEDLLSWVEGENLTVLMVTHDLEEAVAVSDRVVLLGNGPRAQVKGRWEIDLPRPRDLLQVKEQPRFAAIARELWSSLSEEVRTPTVRRRPDLKVVNQ